MGSKVVVEPEDIVREGHFELSSGLHSSKYVDKYRILEYPHVLKDFAEDIANQFKGRVNVVVGPTTGGDIVAYEVARQLGVRAVVAEKDDDGKRVIGRGYTFDDGPYSALVVDDVYTTGTTLEHTVRATWQKAAISIAGVAVMIRRGQQAFYVEGMEIPVYSVVDWPIVTTATDSCEQCKEKVPITDQYAT